MDKCSKLKLFHFLLLFSAINVVLYRYFSRRDAHAAARLDYSRRQLQQHVQIPIANDTRRLLGTDHFNSQDIINDNKEDGIHIVSIPPTEDMTLVKHIDEVDVRKPDTNAMKSTISSPLSAPETVPPPKMVAGPSQTGSPWPDNVHIPVTLSDSSVGYSQSGSMSLCPLLPPKLNGPLATYLEPSSWEEIAADNPELQLGGRYKPANCEARHRVAIVIPFRNRDKHLQILLRNLHPMLSRQQLDYGIFVIDQVLPGKFNRAMLMNIGYVEAMKRYDYQCVVFHDVDLVPENDKNIYSCPLMPRHLSAAIDKFHYKLPYSRIYGGVSAVNKEQFEKINGFSNMFFGWGGEDDDMAKRISHAGLHITRYPMSIARYKMIRHVHDAGNEHNPKRFNLLKTTTHRMAKDGLNSLVYNIKSVHQLPTHLRIQVVINEDEILKRKRSLL